MADLWYPKGVMRPAADDLWGRTFSYLEKEVVHVTVQRGHNLVYGGKRSYYGHTGFPNQTLCVIDGRWTIAKHIPSNRASRALQNLRGGVETNNDFASQTEIACMPLRKGTDLPDEAYEVYAEFLAWLNKTLGLPLKTSVTFYGEDAGFPLATQWARQRLSGGVYDAYRGLLGHQHVPENDHWDPGKFDVQRVIALATKKPVTPVPTEDEFVKLSNITPGNDAGHPDTEAVFVMLANKVWPDRKLTMSDDPYSRAARQKCCKDMNSFFGVNKGVDPERMHTDSWRLLFMLATNNGK